MLLQFMKYTCSQIISEHKFYILQKIEKWSKLKLPILTDWSTWDACRSICGQESYEENHSRRTQKLFK